MKRIKTLLLLIAIFGVVTLNSCKKDKKEAVVSLTADLDGTATNFSVSPVALQGAVDGQTFTVIQGSTSTGATLSITIAGKVTAGKTYSDAATSDDDKPLFLYATSPTADDYLNDDDDTANLPSITITSVTSTTIGGTFKGKVGLLSEGAQVKSITNGKFHVNIQTHP
ncbi:hypothetical protein [Mucilaginibacter sp.]|jgi:hypothetical protein|uniref:hypothetical protein n=1 Tax=Mucilaginibacter sp. TaxID=1882438 RepID=UPI002BC7FC78|nr:hypothetical protein [Mucilaginibacter sp.]HTI60597.1 hypothetical protein [Mucilaginibacter sp.]